MKLFNIENNQEVVYVQMNDLAYLMHSDEEIPAVIVTKVFGNGVVIIDNRNRDEFVRFDNPIAVNYFKKADWIPDFKFYYKLSEEDLISYGQDVVDEMNKIADEFNAIPDEERKDHMDLRNKHDLLEYKFASLPRILKYKKGLEEIPFPEVIDNDGFSLNADQEGCNYAVKQGLNPMQAFLYRIDGQELTDDEEIPFGLLQSSLSILIMKNMECNEFFGDFEQTRKVSDDKKYLITTFKVTPKEEIKKEKEENKTQDIKLTFGKKVKQFFNNLLKG